MALVIVGSNPIDHTETMFHYVYCIENLINGKVYVGKHSTDDLDDGYMGSGKLLNRAIKKHGIENFRKHVLAMFETSEEAFDLERQLVTEEFVADENTYNLIEGGQGGNSWIYANANEHTCKQRHDRVSEQMKSLWKDPEFRRKHLERTRAMWINGKVKHVDWTGKHHTDESRMKIGVANSIQQRGEKNSQFGTVWISNLTLKKSQKIKIEELDSFLEQGWIKGRKMKW